MFSSTINNVNGSGMSSVSTDATSVNKAWVDPRDKYIKTSSVMPNSSGAGSVKVMYKKF